jgi:hypothetical protein
MDEVTDMVPVTVYYLNRREWSAVAIAATAICYVAFKFGRERERLFLEKRLLEKR